MIKISFDSKNKKVLVNLYGIDDSEIFDNVNKILSLNNYYYDKSIKRYSGSPIVYDSLIDDLYNSNLDIIIDVHPYTEKLIEESSNVPIKIKKYRISEDDIRNNINQLLKYQPLKGKHPNENYQLEDLYKLSRLNAGACFNQQGTGKAQSLDCKIYTPNGYTIMRDIKIGDIILNPDGGVSSVTAIHPQGKKDIYEVIFTDGSKTECCKEHLWNIRYRRYINNKYEYFYNTIPFKDILNTPLINKYGNRNFIIPITQPVNFYSQRLIIHPYIMGCLLADGCFRGSTLTYTKFDFNIIKDINNYIDNNMLLKKQKIKGQFSFIKKKKGVKDNLYIKELKKLNIWGKKSINKFIPDIYKYNSITNRLLLLQGLLDGDGYYSGNSTYYYSSSFQLINDIKELVESLGGVAFLKVKKNPKYTYKGKIKTGKDSYSLTIRMPENLIPFKNKNLDIYKPLVKYKPYRAIKEINYLGVKESQCITTSYEKGLYLTDSFIVTHNSFYISYMMSYLLNNSNISKAFIVVPFDGMINLKKEILKFSKVFKEDDFLLITSDNKEEMFKLNDYKVLMMTYSAVKTVSDFFYIEKYLKNKKKRENGKLIPLTKRDIRNRIPKKYTKPTIPFSEWIGENNKALYMLDESHLIANPNSITSHFVNLYEHFFYYKYIFTGTPADKYEKYYSQMKFLDETLINNQTYKDFKLSIAQMDEFGSSIVEYKEDKVNKFIERISPYTTMRLAKDVLDLPENYIKKSYINMNEKMKAIYQGLTTLTLYKISKENEGLDIKKIFNKFPYLIQAIDNPCLLKDKLVAEDDTFEFVENLNNHLKKWKFSDHPKLDLTNYWLNKYIKEEGRKVILWEVHPYTINQLAEYYKKYNPIILHGEISEYKKDRIGYRQSLVDQFKKDDKIKLFIASLNVLNKSVTMTEATRQIYFVRNFEYIKFNQSLFRIHRYGTTEEVITHIPLIDNSIELHLDKILDGKDDTNKILATKKYLTKNELRDIFEGKGL